MVAYFKLSDMRGTRPAGFDTLAALQAYSLQDLIHSNQMLSRPLLLFRTLSEEILYHAQNFVRDPNGHSRARTESSATACWR